VFKIPCKSKPARQHIISSLKSGDEEATLKEHLSGKTISKLQEELLMVHQSTSLETLTIDVHEFVELLLGVVETIEVEIFIAGDNTESVLATTDTTLSTLDDPLEDTSVFTETRPQELLVGISAEEVDHEDEGLLGELLADGEVVLDIISGVVAHEGEHGEGVVTESTFLDVELSGGRLRADGGTGVHTSGPVEGLVDEGNVRSATTTVDDGRDGDTSGVVPGGVEGGAVVDGRGEARVGVSSNATAAGGPLLAEPVDEALGDGAIGLHALPPDVVGGGVVADVGEDGVLGDGSHGNGVGGVVGTRSCEKMNIGKI